MECMAAIEQELKQAGIPYTCQEPLAHHTSFRIGGPAAVFCQPASREQLIQVVSLCRAKGVRYYLLGNGSNLLFSDQGFDGVVISTTHACNQIEIQDTCLRAGAGASLKDVCLAAAQQGLSGLEFAYGIPGSVGGAVYMNAGAYGGEMKDVLACVEFLDEQGQIRTLCADALELGYRTSIFGRTGWLVLSAEIHLKKAEAEQIRAVMDDLMQRRVDKQPLELPSAGSAFKRPEGAFAGGLIDQCGLRGFRVGDAAISQKHCGFIVNLGNATCADVLELARQVSEIVQEKTGYRLEKEIRVVE